MSYDIHFVPKSPDQSWEEALEALEERAAVDARLSPESLERFATLVAAIAGDDEGYETDRSDTFWELTHATRPVAVSMSEQGVTLSVPYGQHGGRTPKEQAQRLMMLGMLVEKHTGLLGYDLQRDRAFFAGEVLEEVTEGLVQGDQLVSYVAKIGEATEAAAAGGAEMSPAPSPTGAWQPDLGSALMWAAATAAFAWMVWARTGGAVVNPMGRRGQWFASALDSMDAMVGPWPPNLMLVGLAGWSLWGLINALLMREDA